jgi:hypothetical protein
MCDDKLKPTLDANEKVILETADDQRLELVTRHETGIAVNAGGTYLNPTDNAKLARHTNATLRPYSWRDTLGKVLSGAGIVTLLLTATALATPVAALVLLHFQQPGQNVAAVADLAQTVLQWTRQPVDALDLAQPPTSAQVSAARVEVNRRSEEASGCFRTVQGHQAPTASIPGVSCSSPQTQWWQDPATAPLVATALGLITAALGLAKLRTSFGFQKSPTI